MLYWAIIAFDKSILIWFGMWLLLNQKIGWLRLTVNVGLMSLFTLIGTLLLGPWIRPFLFFFSFLLVSLDGFRFTKDAKIKGFYLSFIFMILMLSRAWANFITYHLTTRQQFYSNGGLPYFAHYHDNLLALILKLCICVCLLLVCRRILEQTGVNQCMHQIDDKKQLLLAGSMWVILMSYYGVVLLPEKFYVDCSGMVRLKPMYFTVLTMISTWIIYLFKELFKEQIALMESKETLADKNRAIAFINESLLLKEKEISEKLEIIEDLDAKITDIEGVGKRLRDFEHGQLELLMALGGGVATGNQALIYDLLESYGEKVEEVLKHRPQFPDVNQLKTQGLMPLRFFLLSKANKAMKQGITLSIEMPEIIDDVGMPILDLIDILGIWLNNALEEVTHLTEKWVHLSFILVQNEGGKTLEIRVSNPCREGTRHPAVLNGDGVSTKGENRGSGLRIVMDLMMKHSQVFVSTTVKEKKFKQLLEIGLEEA